MRGNSLSIGDYPGCKHQVYACQCLNLFCKREDNMEPSIRWYRWKTSTQGQRYLATVAGEKNSTFQKMEWIPGRLGNVILRRVAVCFCFFVSWFDLFLFFLCDFHEIYFDDREKILHNCHYLSAMTVRTWLTANHNVASGLLTENTCRDSYPFATWYYRFPDIMWVLIGAVSLSGGKVFGPLTTNKKQLPANY